MDHFCYKSLHFKVRSWALALYRETEAQLQTFFFCSDLVNF